MFLKNYTSEVPVTQTIYRIEQALIRAGVHGIAKEYAGTTGKIVAITFAVKIDGVTPISIRLPADEERAWQALWLDYADGDPLTPDGQRVSWKSGRSQKKKHRADFKEQAERTAWKLIQDWVEVQLSMISLKQADFVQVFLPYVWNGERTYYQALKESKFAGLLPEKASD